MAQSSRFVRLRTGKQAAGRTIAVPYGLGDDVAAAVVLRIFSEFADPYKRVSLSEIADGLNVDGIPTSRGGKWHASTVRYILNNPAYTALVGAALFDQAQARLQRLRPGPPK